MDRLRAYAAHLLWWAGVACAVVLALGAGLVALQADPSLSAVRLGLDAADAVGLGWFGPRGGLVEMGGAWGRVHSALVNGAVGALAWLLAARLLSGLAAPPRAS